MFLVVKIRRRLATEKFIQKFTPMVKMIANCNKGFNFIRKTYNNPCNSSGIAAVLNSKRKFYISEFYSVGDRTTDLLQ